jgi:hypothetical protein
MTVAHRCCWHELGVPELGNVLFFRLPQEPNDLLCRVPLRCHCLVFRLGNYSHFDPTQAAFNLRRRIETDQDGRYRFRSIINQAYGRLTYDCQAACKQRYFKS